MRRKTTPFLVIFAVLAFSLPVLAQKQDKKGKYTDGQGIASLWSDPIDIASRNLFYGSGGEQDQPQGTMTFLEEDFKGTNPKFVVRDHEGTKWTVKLGVEVQPETAAVRLLWAAGYFTTEDYFVSTIKVENMPAHLKRGQELVGPGGVIENVRLKRHPKGKKKIGSWRWKRNPFTGTREFNGLRVMMALMNSWDLKDENNAIYEGPEPPRKIYLVSDLGSTFGTTGRGWTHATSKGNLKSYSHSRFISKSTPQFVDFSTPSRAALIYFFTSFPEFFSRLHMRWIGKHIPLADAKWIGGLLGQLSPEQIRDAFRAAGYQPQQVEGFAKTVQERIAELNKL